MKPYVIRQGEYLSKVAFRFGFKADDVWNHAKNKELKEQRGNPEVLCPGDLLWIPKDSKESPLSLTKGSANRFSAKVPGVHVHLVLKDEKGEAIANEAYRIEADGPDPIEGTTGGDGAIDLDVPVHCHAIHVSIEARKLKLDIEVGALDPLTEVTGVQQRLKQLGFFNGTPDGADSGAYKRAIKLFQKSAGLKVTRTMDDDTRKALGQRFGS